MGNGPDESYDEVKKILKQKRKAEILKRLDAEILDEIYKELKEEYNRSQKPSNDIKVEKKKVVEAPTKVKTFVQKKPVEIIDEKEIPKELYIAVKPILKVASHALKYANKNIPKQDWVEVIGLLAGKLDKKNDILHIEDAYPIGHGDAIHAEMVVQKGSKSGFEKAYELIIKEKLFICGWYHSHPSYGCFMSNDDIDTHARYQKLWDKSVALVIDPYLIDGTSAGFEIYRSDIKTRAWYPLVYGVKGSLDIKMLPEILDFMNPIINGKPAYLEYDE
jgi:proteasome lid subunit RPN8/RPN11